MRCKVIYLTIFSLLVLYAQAQALEICGDIKQGELLLIKSDNAKKITVLKNLDDKNYSINENGEALVALHRDIAQKLQFKTDDGASYELNVAHTKWDIQRITGVQQKHVTPSKQDENEIIREQQDVGRALKHNNTAQYWLEGFILPVNGKISGNFGNQRIFNGIPKSPHSGTDIAAPEGTPVKASGSGRVVLSGKNYFYTGNMVIIDHGQGLQTIYAHLKDAIVNEGDEIRQGQIIGHVGKTGRATGPHLHWGASVNNVRFRPHSLLDINNKKCQKVVGKYMGK